MWSANNVCHPLLGDSSRRGAKVLYSTTDWLPALELTACFGWPSLPDMRVPEGGKTSWNVLHDIMTGDGGLLFFACLPSIRVLRAVKGVVGEARLGTFAGADTRVYRTAAVCIWDYSTIARMPVGTLDQPPMPCNNHDCIAPVG